MFDESRRQPILRIQPSYDRKGMVLQVLLAWREPSESSAERAIGPEKPAPLQPNDRLPVIRQQRQIERVDYRLSCPGSNPEAKLEPG
jgi:hypothetical protein